MNNNDYNTEAKKVELYKAIVLIKISPSLKQFFFIR